MKRLSIILKTRVIAATIVLGFFSTASACNLTFTNLISLTPSGPNWVISANLCIGAGVTGVTQGADGDTRDFAWGFYGPGGGPVNILAFDPNVAPMVQSTFTGCQLPGFDVGPAPISPFFTQGTIYYSYDPYSFPACGPGFTCIASTASCGNVHQNCFTFNFTVDVIPDSVRVFGIEGGGNPVAGCYPNPDMLLTFGTLPIIWGEFTGASKPEGNHLNWSTAVENDNDHFEVLRGRPDGSFEVIGSVDSKGSGKNERQYEHLDANPPQGETQYKIRQVDVNGESDETEVLTLSYTPPKSLSWNQVGPSPTHDRVVARFLSEKARHINLLVADVRGQVVLQQSFEALTGSNSVEVDLSNLQAGMYFLRLNSPDAKLDYKLMKL